MENLNIALLLMIVGMATVFAILLIVIYLGKGLIALVKKYAPKRLLLPNRRQMLLRLFPATSWRLSVRRLR